MFSTGQLQANTQYSTMLECNQLVCFDVEGNKSAPIHLTLVWGIILVIMEYPMVTHYKTTDYNNTSPG